ncbi:hypothetical protein BC826DRAFT_1020988 [Russula brevipes]|nr:hypothetical protein BC826DRAFT_1020988 [Russula brevipes]
MQAWADTLPPLIAGIQPGTIASFPLRFRHAEVDTGARTALLGDAVHIVHQLAGPNLGLGTRQNLRAASSTAVTHGGDIGSHSALAPYTRVGA